MQLLHKAKKFTNNIKDLKQIYMFQIKSRLDQSAVVCHSSLSNKNRNDLEQIQSLLSGVSLVKVIVDLKRPLRNFYYYCYLSLLSLGYGLLETWFTGILAIASTFLTYSFSSVVFIKLSDH